VVSTGSTTGSGGFDGRARGVERGNHQDVDSGGGFDRLNHQGSVSTNGAAGSTGGATGSTGEADEMLVAMRAGKVPESVISRIEALTTAMNLAASALLSAVDTTPAVDAIPAVEPVTVAPLPAPSLPSVESASGFSSRSASVTETPDDSVGGFDRLNHQRDGLNHRETPDDNNGGFDRLNHHTDGLNHRETPDDSVGGFDTLNHHTDGPNQQTPIIISVETIDAAADGFDMLNHLDTLDDEIVAVS
jgi:hypothetical protein